MKYEYIFYNRFITVDTVIRRIRVLLIKHGGGREAVIFSSLFLTLYTTCILGIQHMSTSTHIGHIHNTKMARFATRTA